MAILFAAVVGVLGLLEAASPPAGTLRLYDPRCDYLVNPLGIDDAQP